MQMRSIKNNKSIAKEVFASEEFASTMMTMKRESDRKALCNTWFEK